MIFSILVRFVPHDVAQIPWGHNRLIITKCLAGSRKPEDVTLKYCDKKTYATFASINENNITEIGKKMENKMYEFTAEIKKVPGIDGAYIEFPYDLKKEFGKGRLKVHAEFDGEPYNGSIVNMGLKNNDGTICYIIGIRNDIRKIINKNCGDKINVKIKERKE